MLKLQTSEQLNRIHNHILLVTLEQYIRSWLKHLGVDNLHAKNQAFKITSLAKNHTFKITSLAKNQTFKVTSLAKNQAFKIPSLAKNRAFKIPSLDKLLGDHVLWSIIQSKNILSMAALCLNVSAWTAEWLWSTYGISTQSSAKQKTS